MKNYTLLITISLLIPINSINATAAKLVHAILKVAGKTLPHQTNTRTITTAQAEYQKPKTEYECPLSKAIEDSNELIEQSIELRNTLMVLALSSNESSKKITFAKYLVARCDHNPQNTKDSVDLLHAMCAKQEPQPQHKKK